MPRKRKSFLETFFPAFGYMEMGNIMSLVLGVTCIPFSKNMFISGIFAFCAAFVYLSLVFAAAYKDGVYWRKPLKDGEKPPKRRWLLISLALWGISIAMSFTALLGTPVYLLLNGAVSPFGALFEAAYLPYIGSGFYALTVPACLLGFWCGLYDKLNTDKIIYK